LRIGFVTGAEVVEKFGKSGFEGGVVFPVLEVTGME
jgi:hypothetical protein